MNTSEPDDLLPLTPAVFHILLVLAGGESHGYGIMLEVDRLTGGQLHLGPGTLYRSTAKLLADGLIERAAGADPADERRCTYRITGRGLQVVRAEARRLDHLVREARRRGLLVENDAAARARPRRSPA